VRRLDSLAAALLDKETLDEKEILEVVGVPVTGNSEPAPSIGPSPTSGATVSN
jgi:hypothetical protein